MVVAQRAAGQVGTDALTPPGLRKLGETGDASMRQLEWFV
jgi:hypothetical protein